MDDEEQHILEPANGLEAFLVWKGVWAHHGQRIATPAARDPRSG